jgi:tRNA threonylcarbamoyladenosine biosynthesis protein TsaE
VRNAEALQAPAGPLDERALRAWGRQLGGTLPLPVVITLRGDLGAGKTTLAQALLAGAGVQEAVTSPTFALVQWYESPRGRIAHLDLYRLRQAEELDALGWDDIQREAALIVVEWPERAAAWMPRPRLDLHLTDPADAADRRVVELSWLT